MLWLFPCKARFETGSISSRCRLKDEGLKSDNATKDARIEIQDDKQEKVTRILIEVLSKSTSLDMLKCQ